MQSQKQGKSSRIQHLKIISPKPPRKQVAWQFIRRDKSKEAISHKASVCSQISQEMVVTVSLKFTQSQFHYHRLVHLLNLHYSCHMHATNQKDFIQGCNVGKKEMGRQQWRKTCLRSREHFMQSQDQERELPSKNFASLFWLSAFYAPSQPFFFSNFFFWRGECVLRSVSPLFDFAFLFIIFFLFFFLEN